MTSQHRRPPRRTTSATCSRRRTLIASLYCLVLFLSTTGMNVFVRAAFQISSGGRTRLSTVVGARFSRRPPASPLSFFLDSSSRQSSSLLFSTSSSSQNSNHEMDVVLDELQRETGYKRPGVHWYPGHIAKAERQLSETLRCVDVIIEVRDARICKATSHPRVGEWCAGRPRIVVLTKSDLIPKQALVAWKKAYQELGAERWDDAPINTQVSNQAKQAQAVRTQFVNGPKIEKSSDKQKNKNNQIVTPVDQVLFVNAKQGGGIHALHRAIFKAGQHVQERRERRGLKERPLRVGIIGYPNVGKSALINRILGRRRARTANTPGVTRSLQWIRVKTDELKTSVKKEFELLDSPGIIPAKMVDQSDAVLLAACNCIGTAAYDNQAVAAYLCEWLKATYLIGKGHVTAPEWPQKCKERYGFDPMEEVRIHDDSTTKQLRSGEDMLFLVADNKCRGDPEDAARKILQDFRAGRMGPTCLQVAPESSQDDGQVAVPVGAMDGSQDIKQDLLKRQQEQAQLTQERAQLAVETAKERGLELPPVVLEQQNDDSTTVQEDDVGKGLFDGW